MSEPTSAVQDPTGTARRLLAQARDWTERLLGGTEKLRVVIVLAAVLGLDTADKATISAVAGSLESAFKIGNTDIGLLVSAVSFVGAIATLPVGILVDRVCRKRVLLFAIALWSVATWVSGTATSFLYLLGARICLGAVAAAATPAVASLTGDFVPAHGRARVY
ncbi:MAG: MFS transporter, partial [Gammaproteobacteria bacterium]